MLEQLRDAILGTAKRAGARGMPMGEIVDELEARGFDVGKIEQALWELLREGHLLPTGFVCRTVRRRDGAGASWDARTYELLLAAESDQLELELREGR